MAALPATISKMMGHGLHAGLIPESVLLGAIGYIIPTMVNQSLESGHDMTGAIEAVGDVASDPMGFDKRKFLEQMAAMPKTAGVLKGIASVGHDFARGAVLPIRGNKTLQDTALSIGSKAAIGFGAYEAGKAIGKKARPLGYTQMLKNNILAGKIKPEELSQEDLKSVQELTK